MTDNDDTTDDDGSFGGGVTPPHRPRPLGSRPPGEGETTTHAEARRVAGEGPAHAAPEARFRGEAEAARRSPAGSTGRHTSSFISEEEE